MSFFAGKYLVALGFVTALQILPSQPSLASLQSSDSARTLPKATAAASIEMLTDAEGVDFGPFLQSVYRSVKREWLSAMAPSIEKGNKGIVTIQFRVEQDGKVPDDFLKVVSNSGEKEFEYAARNAIRNMRPFEHLPSRFPQPFDELRMIFYYNTPPPKAQ
jgi:TonB family protein